MSGKFDLGECLSLDADHLQYLSPVESPPTSNDGYFFFDKLRFLAVPAQNASGHINRRTDSRTLQLIE